MFYYIFTINVIPSRSTGCIKKLNGQPKALLQKALWVAPNLKTWLGRSTSFTCTRHMHTHTRYSYSFVSKCVYACLFLWSTLVSFFFLEHFHWYGCLSSELAWLALCLGKDFGILWSEWVYGGVVWSFAWHLHQSWTARWMDGWMALLFDIKACSLGGHVKTENSRIQSNEMKNHFPACL